MTSYKIHPRTNKIVNASKVYKTNKKALGGRPELQIIGPLQLAIHVVQNRHAGEQKSHWDKTNKEHYNLELCMSFVCHVPVRLLLSSVAVLYHVNGQLQRTYWFR